MTRAFVRTGKAATLYQVEFYLLPNYIQNYGNFQQNQGRKNYVYKKIRLYLNENLHKYFSEASAIQQLKKTQKATLDGT